LGVVAAKMYAGAPLNLGALAGVWGLSVALAAYTTRDISGAHLNPAVTAALTVNKDFPKEEVAPYVGSQCLGATLAGAANYIIFRSGIAAMEAQAAIVRGAAASHASFSGAFGMTPNPALCNTLGAFALEIWMTSILVCSIFGITDPESSVPSGAAPALIGAAVAILVSVFGPVTGCGMNPARDLGPRLVTALCGWGTAALSGGAWWVYTAGPIVGGILGGAFYLQFLAKPKKE